MWIYIEWHQTKGLQGWWAHNWHVVGGVDADCSHIGTGTRTYIRDPILEIQQGSINNQLNAYLNAELKYKENMIENTDKTRTQRVLNVRLQVQGPQSSVPPHLHNHNKLEQGHVAAVKHL